MNKNGKLRKLLSKVLIFMTIITLTVGSNASLIAAANIIVPEGTYLVSNTTKKIAPGIKESTIVTNNKSGTKQNIDYACEIDLEGTATTKIISGYAGYDASSWKMDKLTNQAKVAETKTGLNVVAGINADFYNMANGQPLGMLIMEGKVYNKGTNPYFAITKDGKAEIRDGNVPIDDVESAVGGDIIMVKDGKAVNLDDNNSYQNILYSRQAIGIKADGSVVTFTTHGRNYPLSNGHTYREMAELMIGLGCVTVLNLDGGGSATYASQYEGSNDFDVRNSPSDGTERKVSSTLLIVSTAKPTGEFDHASISPNDLVYTPKSTVQFEAKGVDSSGGEAPLPSDLTWKLDDAYSSYGQIDSKGLFTSNGKAGDVKINVLSGGKIVGSTQITIAEPDSISFSSEEISLGFDRQSNLGLVVKYKGRDVIYKDGDFKWTMDDESMGTFNGNIFTSSSSATINGHITATSVYDSSVSGSVYAIIGRLPSVMLDFEDVVDEETGTTTKAEDYYTITRDRTDTQSLLLLANYNRGGKESAELVDLDSGEPVRFGNNSLKLSYDFSGDINATEGACIGFTEETKKIEGTPTGIGMWVYAPEGTPNLWLRIYLNDGNGNLVPLNFTEEAKISEGKMNGIDWSGWKYVEASLEGRTGPFSLVKGQTIRLMYVPGTKQGFYTKGATKEDGTYEMVEVPKAQRKGSVYIDNLQFVYGANNDDIDNPNVDSITANNTEIKDGMTIDTNTISFKSLFSDVENKNTSGIDHDTVRIYLDGVNMSSEKNCVLVPGDNTINLYDVKLSNGPHNVKVLVRDKFGNETIETRNFIVNGDKEYTNATLSPISEGNPILNKDFELGLSSGNIEDIKSIETEIKVNNDFKDFEVKFNDGFEGTSSYDSKTSTIKLSAARKDGSVLDNTDKNIAKLTFKVPKDLKKGSKFTYYAQKGVITYNSEKEEGFTGTFATLQESLEVLAPLSVKADPMIIGSSGKIYVYDLEEKAVADASIYKLDGTLLGKTNEEGYFETDELCKEVGKYTIYAEKGEDISYSINIQNSTSAGNEDGLPEYVISNATSNSTNSKNIAWMSNPQKSDNKAIVQIATKVQYDAEGEVAFNNTDQVGVSKLQSFLGSSDATKNYSVRVNKVTATNLNKNTTYAYRVGDGKNWSEVKEFKTTRSGTNTNFFVIGDTQIANKENVDKISEQLSKGNYSFGIQTGDSVDDASVYGDWVDVLEMFGGSYLSKVDMVHVLGNHEYMGDLEGEAAQSIYNLPNDRRYSVEYGNVYVATISYTTSKSQLKSDLEWLKEDAKNSKAKWKVLSMHQPAYYSNPSGSNEMINELVPSAAEVAGIDFVFSGHDHSYARTQPIKEGQVNNDDGVVYYICGSTGEKSYGVVDNKDFHFANPPSTDFGAIYLTASTTDNEFKVETHEADGTVIDTYTKTKTSKDCVDGHDYIYDDGYLTCSRCGTSRELGDYTGFATDEKTNKKMYFIAGVAKKGWFTYGQSEVYHFGEDGLAHELEVIKETKTNCTERGSKVVKCKTDGEEYTLNDVQPPGHDFQPVEQADGSIKYICAHKEYDCNAEGKYIGDEKISLSYTKTTYNGNKKSPAVTIEGLTRGEDYTVSYWDNVNAGTARVRVKAKGNTYAGMTYIEYTIKPQSISNKEATLSFTTVDCSGEEQKPEVTIPGLESGKDFSVKYTNNIEPGTAQVTITGKGNYTGIITKEFKILDETLDKVTGLKSSNRTSTGFKLSWNKVEDSDGYKVYEYNATDKTYKLVDTIQGTDNTSYTLKDLEEGTTYRYAIRAYKQLENNHVQAGPYSNLLTTSTYPGKVTGLEANNITSESMELKWSSVSNASGYKVYEYNENDKSYTLVTTLQGKNSTTYKVENLKSGATYKYAVRAYKVLGKSTYNGAYSDVFSMNMVESPSKVTGLTTKNRTTSTITLQWNKVEGSDGYKVYEYNISNNSYKEVIDISGNENISYELTDLKAGTTYRYAVRAYKKSDDNKYLGEYSSVLTTTTYPSKVTGVTTSNRTTSGFKLKWNKVTNCEGYKIYTYNEADNTYKYMKTIEGNDNTAYDVKNLSSGTTYKYAVRAYKKVGQYTFNSQYSNVLTTTTLPLKVKDLTTEKRASTNITLSWEKVSRAEGYRIYRYNSENKKYELLDEVEGNEKTTYNDKNLVSGKNYYYKVKAYKKIGKYTYLSSYSDSLKTCSRPEKTELKLSTPSSGSVRLTWKDVKYVSGYDIYRSTSKDGKYTKVNTIKDGDAIKYTNYGLSKNKVYYYKVRSYKMVDDEKVYSYFSDIVNIKTI